MSLAFNQSQFNGDISKWNVSKVCNMYGMFNQSKFDGDLSDWKVSSLEAVNNIFDISRNDSSSIVISVPYWAKITDVEERKKAVQDYELHNDVTQKIQQLRTNITKINQHKPN